MQHRPVVRASPAVDRIVAVVVGYRNSCMGFAPVGWQCNSWSILEGRS